MPHHNKKTEVEKSPLVVTRDVKTNKVTSVTIPSNLQVGSNAFKSSITVSDSVTAKTGFSGSLTKLADGTTDFLQAGSNVTITKNSDGSITIASTASGGGGAVESVTAGTGLTDSGTAEDPELELDLSDLTTSTSDGDGDYFVVVDTGGAQKKLTKGNINISGFNNDSGFTTNTGDIEGVTAGTGLSGGGTSGTVTLDLDFSELTDMTGDIAGTTEFILQDGTTESRKAASEIKLSNFNNDSGWTSNTGDIEGVTAGNGLSGGGTSGTVTLNLDINGLDEISGDAEGTDVIAIYDESETTVKNKAFSDLQLSLFEDDLGHISSVTAGTGISGGGSSGAVSLALDVSELTALGATADNSDYVVIEDVTDNSTKKVLISNLPSSGGGSLTCGFQAYMSSNQNVTTSTTTIQFNSEQFDIGSDFNTSTYTFTAPSTGKYLFNVLLWFNTIQSAVSYYDLTLVTSNRSYSLVSLDARGFDTNVAYYTMQGHLLVDMDASDTASVSILQGGGVSGTTTIQTTNFGLRASLFTGYLVG